MNLQELLESQVFLRFGKCVSKLCEACNLRGWWLVAVCSLLSLLYFVLSVVTQFQ